MILVVEDRSSLSTVLRKLLSLEGYAVHVSECGIDALAWMRTHCPRLVLMDNRMPDMTGLDVVRQAIQEHLINPSRVLFYTSAPDDVTSQMIPLGVGGCIEKGTDWNVMRRRIAHQLLVVGPRTDGVPPTAAA